VLGGQHHVAGQRELAAAAQGQSVDRRDDGQPALLDRREGPQAVGDEVAARRGAVEFGERLDISAGGERTVTAPVSTTARTSGCAAAASSRPRSCGQNAAVSALALPGRLIRQTATGPARSVSKWSK
jgi:hypothetical protein